jgi:hypothetical protein
VQFHQRFEREIDAREAGFHASEGGEIFVQPGPELRQVRQGGQLRCGPLRLMMEAHRLDELVREAPLGDQSGADLAVVAPQ